MTKRPVLRFGAVCATLAFMATGGLTGIQLHPLSHQGPHARDLIAIDLGSPPGEIHEAPHDGSHHGPQQKEASTSGASHHGASHHGASHHGASHHGASHHGSSEECTCVGPCQGTATQASTSAADDVISVGESHRARTLLATVVLIRPSETSYLFPLPNAPPVHG